MYIYIYIYLCLCVFISLLFVTAGIVYSKIGSNINVIVFCLMARIFR